MLEPAEQHLSPNFETQNTAQEVAASEQTALSFKGSPER